MFHANAPELPTFDTRMVYDGGEGQWFATVGVYYTGGAGEVTETEFHDGDYSTVLSAAHGYVENEIASRMHLDSVYGFTFGGRKGSLGVSGIVASTPEEVLSVVYKYLGKDYDAGTIAALKSHFNYDDYGDSDTDEFVRIILIEQGTAAWINGAWSWERTGETVFTLTSDRDVNRTV